MVDTEINLDDLIAQQDSLINNQLAQSIRILQKEDTANLVKLVARLTGAYYHELIDQGIPPDAAATITASYSSQIAALKP